MRDKIMAMEAGSDLDTEVGKTFKLGYKNEFRAIVGEGMINWFTELSEAKEWHWDFIKKNPNHPYSKNGGHIEAAMVYNNYSTDAGQAWAIAEMFPIVNVQYVEIYEGHKTYSVEMPRESGTTTFQCRSLPEAICKAALLAVIES